jgi:3-isopropylmalate/(R)-2-methylmalate dehydratase small subunit
VVFEGLGEHAFEDDRSQLKEAGKLHAFDDTRFSEAEVLVVNKNFGCGSSREHAPQAIMRWGKGVRAIVGESFAEIFYGNCISLGIPCAVVEADVAEKLMALVETDPSVEVTVDVDARQITAGNQSFACEIPNGPSQQFLEGRWDSTTELLTGKDVIKKTADALPYFSGFSN